jgi:undecaprenyl-diphosphatase
LTLFEGIILGLVQGFAEFLPISSSGHLAILQHFFGIDGEKILSFAVMLHFGTLLSLFAVYYKDIWDLILELLSTFKDVFAGKGLRINANETRRLGFMIIVATIPTAIIGLLFNDLFSGLYNSLSSIGICLLITGTVLWFIEKKEPKGKNVSNMKFMDAVLIGLFQSIAIAPGISRSGATIAGSLFSGLNRALAIKFAFLISIPSILGAVILEAPNAFAEGMDTQFVVPIIAGVIVAAVAGFIAIKTMIRVVSNKKLYIFSFYTWTVGALVLLYTFIL